MRRWGLLGMVAMAALALLAFVACEEAGTTVQPTTRTIYMEAIEPKGSATVDKEPFPTEALPGGGGYILKQPDATGKWEVEVYTWAPDQVIVYQGDTVNLQVLGVNGTSHDSYIEEYVDSFVVERGKLTNLSFVADQVGVFKIVCTTHQPSMTGELVVLPR